MVAEKSMEISYVVVVHNNPEQFGRLLRRLQAQGVRFFVHVDRKADQETFEAQTSAMTNVYYIQKRWVVRWGDYSVVGAYVECLRDVVRHAPDSFVFHLSGQDYPVKSNNEINEFVAQYGDLVYMTHFELPYAHWAGNGGMERVLDNWYHIRSRHRVHIRPRRFATQDIKVLSEILVGRPLHFCRALRDSFVKRKYPFVDFKHYGGEFWISMPARVAASVLRFMDENPAVEEYYRRSGHPDEIMLQTLLLNSGQIVSNETLKYIDWSGKRGLSPLTFTIDDEPDLRVAVSDPRVIFARKFDMTIDHQIMDRLDEWIDERGWSMR